ncbi:MAG: ATP-binding protein [Minwuia sp.]|uniref:sensor histidine kinase n=1 Tax=Minwuia sp. TaxID=2493630 RepID=UPI003A8B2327
MAASAVAGLLLFRSGMPLAGTGCLAAALPLAAAVWAFFRLHAAHACIRHHNQRFDAYAEASGQWFWETDADNRYVWFSKSVQKFIDFPREWHYGRSRLELGQDEPSAEWDAHLDDLANHRPFSGFTLVRKAPDGTRFLRSSGVPKFDENGQFQGYYGAGSNITSEIHTHDMLRDAFDALSEGIAVFDNRDRLLFCNRTYIASNQPIADRLKPGLDYAEMIGLFVENTLPEDWTPERRQDWGRTRLALRDSDEPVFETPTYGNRWCRVADHRTRNGGTVVVRTDITSLMERQQELKCERDRAERANRAKTEFLTNMSHELRTPLNAIIGFSEAMHEEILGPLSDRYRRYAGDITDSGRHLLALINDLLDSAKLESGQYEIRHETFDAAACCQTVLTLMQVEFERRRQRLETRIGLPEGTMLHADERAVKQVLLNLLSNAAKFSPAGGEILLSAGCEGADLEIRVTDRGQGIDPADMERVFERFVQVQSAMSRSHSGTGIGLPLSRALAEMHGGTLDLESQPGKGTTAILRLPDVLRFQQSAAAI